MAANDHLGAQFMPVSEIGKLKAANLARNMDDVKPAELTHTVDDWADRNPDARPRRAKPPLSVHNGVLYDGHRRYAKARAEGVEQLPVVGPQDPRFNW